MLSSVYFFAVSAICQDMPPRGEKLRITSPKNGDIFYPGQQITVKAEYSGNSSDIDGIHFLAEDFSNDVITKPPYEYQFIVNKEFLGKMMIMAYVMPPEDKDDSADYVEVMIKTDEIPVKIEMFPSSPYLLSPGDELILAVDGTYADGVARDITLTDKGTIYSSSDDSIFEVLQKDNYMVLKAKKPGRAKLTVKNGIAKTIDVDVQTDKYAP
ncbi:MAG: hypothetical protein FJZ13_05225 [Candidatus Omnitrophica bacterium]|nr:hypothetical protein [Candidatus Omnitrophota bacterium]